MNLSDVSRTAVFTLIMHVIMEKKGIISDPYAGICLEKIIELATDEEKRQISIMEKMLKGIAGHYNIVVPHIKRVTAFDSYANDYISRNKGCTVINLACGFDTRYWRIDNKNCHYIEVDLPEVVALKQDILKEFICYDMIGCSVLDYSWIDKVTTNGKKNFLIIAEGLLMYFSHKDGIEFLKTLPQQFFDSRIVFDMFPRYLTEGLWRVISDWQAKKYMGFKIHMEFGFDKPGDIERISSGFKVIETKKADTRFLIYASINENS